jgi:hypothetical protein
MEWTRKDLKNPPGPRYGHTASVWGSQILIYGGDTGISTKGFYGDALEILDTKGKRQMKDRKIMKAPSKYWRSFKHCSNR